MSPTENDLRAALRDGEDDGGINADWIIRSGRAVRARRRSQLLTTAAAVVLVGGLGAGAALLVSGSNGGESGGAAQDAKGAQRYDDAGGGASVAAPAARPGAGTAPVTCPTSLPRYVLPPTGGAATGSLFTGPVASVVVCAYGVDTAPHAPTRLELRGADAEQLAASLDASSPTRPGGMCPDMRRADEQALAVIGVDAQGERVGLVTTTLGRPACAVDVRNGAVVRYGWQPPARLQAKLRGLVPQGGMSHGPVLQSGSPTK